jgi:outer membrane protein OmpA-like peptidoglycan-associated protein
MRKYDRHFLGFRSPFPAAAGTPTSARATKTSADIRTVGARAAEPEVAGGLHVGHDLSATGLSMEFLSVPSVNRPHDHSEREADRVAETVMRSPAPGEDTGVLTSGRGVAAPTATSPSGMDRGGGSSIVREQGAGQALAPAVRAPFERHFGLDFSKIRIHTDGRAAVSARALHARAYTQGGNIVFGAGQFRPHSGEGRRLLAHELAHVVQQSAGRPAPAIQRQALPQTPPIISPSLARMLGYLTLDGFALNSPDLTVAQRGALSGHAGTLRNLLSAYPGGLIILTGHTDATGTEEHNQELGQQRADAVKRVLMALGIAENAISATSAGESALRVPTTTADVRNRRVQIEFRPVLPATPGGPSLSLHLPPPALPMAPSRPALDLRLPPDYRLPGSTPPPFLAPLPAAPSVTPRRPAVTVSPGGLIWLDIVVNPPGPLPVEARIAREFRERGISLSDDQLLALINGRSEGVAQLETILGGLAPGLDAATRRRLAESIADGLMGSAIRAQVQRERPWLFEVEQERERRMEEMLGGERGRAVEGGLRLRVHF